MRARRMLVIPILLFALAGCAPSAAEPGPSATPEPSPIPTTTAPSGPPQSVLDMACSELLDPAADPFFTGARQAVALRRNENAPPDPPQEILYRQVGALRCVWGGDTRTDGGYDVGIELTVLPDAASQFSPQLWDAADAADTVGNRSALRCFYSRCEFSVLAGDMWIAGTTSHGTDSPSDDARLREQLTALLSNVTTQVARAPHRDGPSTSGAYTGWGGPCGETDGITAILRSASALTPLIAEPDNSGLGPFDAEVVQRAQQSTCSVGDPMADSFSVKVTPGAAWAVDELREGESYAGYVHIDPAELPDGTPAATGWEGVYGVYYVAVDGSLVTVSFARDNGDIADIPGRVLAVVDGIRG